MEYYCTECDGYHKLQKFDTVLHLCKQCAKPFKKRTKVIDRILAHYSDVSVGDLMWYTNNPVIVTEILPNGWVIKDIATGRTRSIVVNMFDVFDNFVLFFRRFQDNNETDKN